MKPVSGVDRDFFIPIPAEVFDDFGEGLTPTTWSVLSVIYRQANFETGLWNGSAKKILAAWGNRLKKERTVQYALERLQELGYIKTFHRPGERHNYLVAIEGYRVRFGPMSGQVLNAAQTSDPRHPVYSSAVIVAQSVVQSLRCEGERTPQRKVSRKGGASALNAEGLQESPQRNDPQNQTEISPRNHGHCGDNCAVSGSVIARIPEVPEQQHQVVGDGGNFRDGVEEHSPTINEPEFLPHVYHLLDRHDVSRQATRAHQKKALELSAAHGSQAFLTALDLWLAEEGSSWPKEKRQYPLGHFVTSGKFEYYAQRVQEIESRRRQSELDARCKEQELEISRTRQIIREELIREEDAIGREFADWQAKHRSPDGFSPTNPTAFERYLVRERLQNWTPDTGESWAALDSLRRSGVDAAIDARMRAGSGRDVTFTAQG